MEYTVAPVSYFNEIAFSYFALFASFVSIIFLLTWEHRKTEGNIFNLIIVGTLFVVTSISLFVHYDRQSNVMNKKVVAELVETAEKEEFVYGGKGRPWKLVTNMYVLYKTPDGIVTFPRKMGFAYPETKILYGNKVD